MSYPTDTTREPFCKLLCINNTMNITKMLSPVVPANSRWKAGVPFTTLCLYVRVLEVITRGIKGNSSSGSQSPLKYEASTKSGENIQK